MAPLYDRIRKLFVVTVTALLLAGTAAGLAAASQGFAEPPVDVLLPAIGDVPGQQDYFPGKVLHRVFGAKKMAERYRVISSLGEVYNLTCPLRRDWGWTIDANRPYMTVVPASIFGSLVLGTGPYVYGKPAKELRALLAMPGEVTVFATLDDRIKTLDDLRGRRVGVGERGNLFRSRYMEQPYFHDAAPDIKWIAGGPMRNVQALLRGELDAVLCTFWAKLAPQSDRTLTAGRLLPDPATRKLLQDRPATRFLSFDPRRIFEAYDDLEGRFLLPVAMQPHADSAERIWGRGNTNLLVGPEELSPTQVRELFDEVIGYLRGRPGDDELAALFPDDLAPFGIPVADWIHPAVTEGAVAVSARVRTGTAGGDQKVLPAGAPLPKGN